MDIIPHVLTAARSVGVQASTEMPASQPQEMVTVRIVGEQSTRFVQQTRFVVHCWAQSDHRAAEVARAVSDAVLLLPDTVDNIASVEQDAMYSDALDGTRRWSASFSATCNR